MVDIKYLKEQANYYSQKFWSNDFGGEIKIDKTMKEYGSCLYPFNIKIHPRNKLFNCSVTYKDDTLNTLLHELCHWFLFKQGISHDHRHKIWKDTLKMVEDTQTINRVIVVLGDKSNWSIVNNTMIYLDEVSNFELKNNQVKITLSNRNKSIEMIKENIDTVLLSPSKCFIGDDYIEKVKEKNKNFVKKNKDYFVNEYKRNLSFFNQYHKFDEYFEEALNENRKEISINEFIKML